MKSERFRERFGLPERAFERLGDVRFRKIERFGGNLMEILNAKQLSRDCAEVFAAPVVAADRASGRSEKSQIARMAEPDGFASLIDKRERSDADVFLSLTSMS